MNIEHRVLQQYPYQIAEPYRSYTNLKEEDYSSRILKLVEIGEILLKTLCAVNMKWFLASNIWDANVNEQLEGFESPSFGRWLSLFREVCRSISSADAVSPPPLVDAITKFYQSRVPGGTQSEVYAAYKTVSEMYGLELEKKVSIRGLFERLGQLRNKVAHGALQALSRIESEELANSLHQMLHHLLQGCDFLCSYEVLYIAEVKKKRGQFCYNAKICRGFYINNDVLFQPEEISEPIEDLELYICSVDRVSSSKPVITWAISLSPYFVLAPCKDCRREQVFVFNGRKRKSVEYLSYQCGHFYEHAGMSDKFEDIRKFPSGEISRANVFTGHLLGDALLNERAVLTFKQRLAAERKAVQALQLISEGSFEHAEELADEVLKEDENSVQAYHALALINIRAGWLGLARTHFERAINISPEHGPSLLGLALVCAELGDIEAGEKHLHSLQHLHSLLRVDPTDAEARFLSQDSLTAAVRITKAVSPKRMQEAADQLVHLIQNAEDHQTTTIRPYLERLPPRQAAESKARDRQAEESAAPGENQSARLRYAIENTYPYPIARPFYELRRTDDWKAQIPQLANILGASLEHVAVLALAEYLSGEARDSELNQRLLEVFKKPISHGTWAGILRDTMTFLSKRTAPLLTSELSALYFGHDKKQASTSIRIIGDELVAMRNDLIKKSVDAPPTHDHYQRFKQRLVEFLQLLAFVKDQPLIAVKHTKMESGLKTHQCSMLVGCHEAFEQVELQCDLDLQQLRVAMLSPATHELLYLYPFYLLRECPELNCQSMHLFRFDRTERSRIEYIAAGGHRLSDQAAGADLHALLDGPWSVQPRLRQEAKYLCLAFTDSWQRRAAGERIAGKYEVIRHLRRGGMSDVYQVTEVNSEQPLALKLFPFQLLSDQKMIQRFRQEALRVRKLDHANITRVFDYGEVLVDHYLVMEKADGWNIGEGRIALDVGELPKPLEETKVIAIIKQACEGLDYIHREQIIHRDIKPGNLLLFAGERVKLADFGIARSRESITLTMTGLAMGTPEYMSPEQAEGKKDLSIASDIYSLGVVMYELISGQPPFKRSTPLATAVAHVRDPVPPLAQTNPHVSSALQQIVMKCLEKDPKDRYDSARTLYQELDRYERGEATQGARKIAAVRYLEKSLSGHEDSVKALAFAPDSMLLASGGADGTIRLWEPQARLMRQTVQAHEVQVTAVAFSPDGRLLFSASYEKLVKLWDGQTLDAMRTLTWQRSPAIEALAVSPDGRLVACGGEIREPGESGQSNRSGEISLWDIQALTLQKTLVGHAFTVTSVAFSPDGTRLASSSWDKTIRLWDVATGELKAMLSGHEGAIYSVAFSPSGETLASASQDQTIRLWNAGTGELVQSLTGHSSRVLTVAFSPDGVTLASGGGEHQKWGEVKLWDARTGKLKQTLRGHNGAVLVVAYSPDSKTLASGSSDGTIGLWNMQQAGNRSLKKNVLWVCDNSERTAPVLELRRGGMTVIVASPDEAMSILLAGHGEETIDFIVSVLGRSADENYRAESDLLFISEAREAGIDLPIYLLSDERVGASNADDVLAVGGNGYVRFNVVHGKFDELPANVVI